MVQVLHHSVEIHLEHSLVHLLHKELGDAVEAELACALEQNHLVAQAPEHLAADERLHGGEEEFLGKLYLVGMGGEHRAYADELHHAALAGQVAHFLVEPFGLVAALEDVAQDERAPTALVVGSPVHEVEGDVERVDV